MLNLLAEPGGFRAFAVHRTLTQAANGSFSLFMLWAIHAQFQNTMYTGLAAAMLLIPGLLSVFAGPLVDRMDKVTIMRVATLLQAICVTALLVFPTANILVALVAIFVFSALSNFEAPAYEAYLPRVVKGDDLIKANSLLNALPIGVGIATGTFLFRRMGDAPGFTWIYIIALSFLVLGFAASLLLKRVETDTQPQSNNISHHLAELKTGFSYLKLGAIRPILAIIIVSNLATELLSPLFPRLVEYNLGLHGSAFMLLTLATLLGTIPGSMLASAFGEKAKLPVLIASGFIVTAIFRVVFVVAISQNLWLAMGMRVIYGAFGTAAFICLTSFQQKYLPKGVLGRVSTVKISIYALAGTIGALSGGMIGSLVEDVNTIFIFQAITYLVIVAIFLLSRQTRTLPKLKDVVPLPELA